MEPRTRFDTTVTSIHAGRGLCVMCSIGERAGVVVGLLVHSQIDMLHLRYIAALHAGLAMDPAVAQKP